MKITATAQEKAEAYRDAKTLLGFLREEAKSTDDINVMLYLDELEETIETLGEGIA